MCVIFSPQAQAECETLQVEQQEMVGLKWLGDQGLGTLRSKKTT